ncbi:MAG: hypothetical protein SynsKO_09070 [Synoicihabitans sp.]
MKHLPFVALCCLLPLAGPAQVVLNFDDITFSNFDPLSADYGDGLDPQIPDIQYATLNAADFSVFENHVELWDGNYGDLTNVVYPSANGMVAQITFAPKEGYGVNLISFDMAGYSFADRTNSIMRILDGGGNVVLDFAEDGPVAIEGNSTGPPRSTFSPDITLTGPLVLQWGTDWDVGLDNIQFQSVNFAAIPEPSTFALFGLGMGLLLGRRCRRIRR